VRAFLEDREALQIQLERQERQDRHSVGVVRVHKEVQEVQEVRGESGLLLSKLRLDGYRNLLFQPNDDD
jgi:hypothetical protein